MAKAKSKVKSRARAKITLSSSWNEFNTFSKLIYPHLQDELKYPPRKSKYFDEQTWVRKRGEKSGPYDGAFKNETGVILLVEAKKEAHKLIQKDVEQLFDYCLGDSFPVPPPYALLSNGRDYKWYKRLKDKAGDFSYAPCDGIPWVEALKQKGSGLLTEQLTLNQTIKLLKVVREIVFDDLTEQYFPDGYSFKKANLGSHKKDFDKILHTRKSFVDPSLGKAKEDVVIKSVLSSIALSLTLKILFIKIITDRKNDPFPEKFKKKIKELENSFPGILKAEPYDALDLSSECEGFISEAMASASITKALVFEDSNNPIGEIWDGLVVSEELDLQVKSLGNVYTPPEIVNAMVDRAEHTMGSWKDKKILEPSCGSGHFVREIYGRVRDSYLGNSGNAQTVVQAHLKTISNIIAQDIDPFAVQTTQLGMFLELYRTPGIWNAIAPDGHFDFGKVVSAGDFLDDGLLSKIGNIKTDLIIGNPPYGVKITKDLEGYFELNSNDSYGAFISRSLDLLRGSGQLLYIVSNTFMTTKTHQKLREQIFNKSKIDSVFQLHRNAFSGRDVFCCIVHLKRKDKNADNKYFYKYCDSWPIHPKSPEYLTALNAWAEDKALSIDDSKYFEYHTNAEFCDLRRHPPHAKELESYFDNQDFIGQRKLLAKQPIAYPITGGLTSLYLLCADQTLPGVITEEKFDFPLIGEIDGLKVSVNSSKVPLVKLWQIARVFQGLCTSDDEYFLRKTKGIIPNARRRYIKDVDERLTISGDQLNDLTAEEKENGIRVIDKAKTPCFVPFDKGGEQDTHAGELRGYWSKEDYWIDWSQEAVSLLKERNTWKQGTSRKPRLQNTRFYFTQGIRFAPAGLYAPMFELSFGGVPGHKGSIILPANEQLTYYLLPILCSSAVRYLTKNFLQHTVMTEIDVIKQIPIPIPSPSEFQSLSDHCQAIIASKRKGQDTTAIENEIDEIVFSLYGFNDYDKLEFKMWFKRRYPHFGKSKDA